MVATVTAPQVPTQQTDLAPHARGWFTGRGDERRALAPGHPSNLSHYRPHRPDELAAARAAVGAATGTTARDWHLMRQVHGADVAVIDETVAPGTVSLDVDALVTAVPGRVLAVSVADCVPILVAGPRSVSAIHAGRRGVQQVVVAAAIAAMGDLGDQPHELVAAIGPAIEGCCYEVPEAMRTEVAAGVAEAAATTWWGTPALDLVAAVRRQLADAGVGRITRTGGCTRCTPGWFSHRADASTGRQFGLVVREPLQET